MKKGERLAWAATIAACVAFFGADRILAPKAYTNVELLEATRDDGWLYITASFIKRECELVSVVFLGKRLGLQDDLTRTWENLNGTPTGRDRMAGEQVLAGRLYVAGLSYDSFEIRTRHNCDGRRVDGVFLKLDGQTLTPKR